MKLFQCARLFAQAALLAVALPAVAQAQNYAFSRAVTGSGTGAGPLKTPNGVALDRSGNLLVADSGNDRIVAFDRTGAYLFQFGMTGSYGAQFSHPTGIAVDSGGFLYVADNYNYRIEKFTGTGVYVAQFGGSDKIGNANSVAAFGPNAIYVADAALSHVQKYDAGGNLVTQFGAGGQAPGQFYAPYGIATDASGAILVADTYNNRIQKFDSGNNFLFQITTFPGTKGSFYLPLGVAADALNNIYVSDSSRGRVVKFDPNGGYITTFGTPGTALRQLNGPAALVIDGAGSVFVADVKNNRVAVFAPANASVSGVLTFEGLAGGAVPQSVAFTFRAADSSADITQTLAVPASGQFTLGGLFSRAGVLHIKAAKYLAVNVAVDLSGGNVSGVTAPLTPGDANNDNRVDVLDFGVLVNAYGGLQSDPASGYDATADFNSDGSVDVLDFGLLVNAYGSVGAL